MTYRHSETLGESRAIDEEFQRIEDDLSLLRSALSVPVLDTEPAAPEVGQIVLADGTNWNPGAGRGIYYWDGSWRKLQE